MKKKCYQRMPNAKSLSSTSLASSFVCLSPHEVFFTVRPLVISFLVPPQTLSFLKAFWTKAIIILISRHAVTHSLYMSSANITCLSVYFNVPFFSAGVTLLKACTSNTSVPVSVATSTAGLSDRDASQFTNNSCVCYVVGDCIDQLVYCIVII